MHGSAGHRRSTRGGIAYRRGTVAGAIGAAGCAVASWLALCPAPAFGAPIASSGPAPSLPAFRGHAAVGHRIKRSSIPPQNPFMAKDPFSNIHNDTWMTDSYRYRGPLGRSLVATSEAKPPRICGSIAFDKRRRLVSVCPSLSGGPQVRIMDPRTLATRVTYDLPDAPNLPGTKLYQNFTGGGYFFLDDEDRIWFVSKRNGKVGTLDRRTGHLRVKTLHEEIENSFAVGSRGVYIVSDRRMYRFEAGRNGAPRVVWKARYKNSGIVKPGQVDAGSGTTPTILPGGYVAITDNAEPMHVVVYRTAAKLHRGIRRIVCQVPVFGKHTGDTENSLIGTRRSLIVENNYGYQDPLGPNAGAVTKPGFARVDIKRHGKGCRKVWTNREVRAPTVVPKISTKSGLIYTYSRPPDSSGSQGYYWTAIDFGNGKTVWSQYAGSGTGYNNNYSGLAIGPDGTAYLGVI